MLWQYTELLFVFSCFCSLLAFYRGIDKVGRVLFLLVGGSSWMGFAVSLLKVHFKWGGSTSVVTYTYIPSTESNFVYIFGFLGFLMFLLGVIRAFELTYQPIIDYSSLMLGNRKREELDEI